MTSITIQQLEAVINEHNNNAKASADSLTLSADVSALADLYGSMIYARQMEVPESELNSSQRALLCHLSAPQATAPSA